MIFWSEGGHDQYENSHTHQKLKISLDDFQSAHTATKVITLSHSKHHSSKARHLPTKYYYPLTCMKHERRFHANRIYYNHQRYGRTSNPCPLPMAPFKAHLHTNLHGPSICIPPSSPSSPLPHQIHNLSPRLFAHHPPHPPRQPHRRPLPHRPRSPAAATEVPSRRGDIISIECRAWKSWGSHFRNAGAWLGQDTEGFLEWEPSVWTDGWGVLVLFEFYIDVLACLIGLASRRSCLWKKTSNKYTHFSPGWASMLAATAVWNTRRLL